MQRKVQMKRHVSLGMKAVLAFETLVELVLFLPLSEECLFSSQSDLGYLYKRTAAGLPQTRSNCARLYVSSVFIYMHREITFNFQSHWGGFVQSMYLHEIRSLWWFRVE